MRNRRKGGIDRSEDRLKGTCTFLVDIEKGGGKKRESLILQRKRKDELPMQTRSLAKRNGGRKKNIVDVLNPSEEEELDIPADRMEVICRLPFGEKRRVNRRGADWDMRVKNHPD